MKISTLVVIILCYIASATIEQCVLAKLDNNPVAGLVISGVHAAVWLLVIYRFFWRDQK